MVQEDRPPSREKSDGVGEKGGQGNTPQPSSSSLANEVRKTEAEGKPRVRSPKEDEILDACRRRDFQRLQALAESPGGFVTDELRQHAWPILLGLLLRIRSEEDEKLPDPDLDTEDLSWENLPRHKDEDQVQLDVDRAFVYYPNFQSPALLASQKTALSHLILSVLRRHPQLHYFQGYHDIAQVFLLVLPPALRAPAVSRLSLLRIRDFMLPTLGAAIAQLRLIPAILRRADPALWAHLARVEPFFALSGTLTMYAHDVQSLGEIARLFDALLAREPVFGVYLFARVVLDRRAELFAVPADEPEVLHSVLSKLPRPLDLDRLVSGTTALLARHPPPSLGDPWHRGIGAHSVLRTAASAADAADQAEAVGEYYFARQVWDLERAERREKLLRAAWRYRRPAAAVGFAVAFGVLAYWMRRSTFLSSAGAALLSTGGGSERPLGHVSAAFSRWWHWEL